MKGHYFLVVLSAVVCTVWSATGWQDCSTNEELQKCLSPIQFLTDDRGFEFFTSREKLDFLCPELNRGLRCVDRYKWRCMTEEEIHHFNRLFNSTIQFIKKLCNPGPYQEEFLIHETCMRQVNDDNENCFHQYLQKIEEIQEKLDYQDNRSAIETSAEDDSDLHTACCSLRDYLVCSQRAMMETCGEQMAKFTEDLLKQISSSLIQDHCESHLQGSDQCHGSSGSQNFPRALLLSISLAIIPLYALRST